MTRQALDSTNAGASPYAASGAAVASRRSRPLFVNAAVSSIGLAVYHAVSMLSGRLPQAGGLGWDGRVYAEMMTRGFSRGEATMLSRPLVVLIDRVPYALGLDVVRSFQVANYVYAFLLYCAVCLLLDRHRVVVSAKVVIIGNLALCIATSKMFAFYPVQVDLGALAVIAWAFYAIDSDHVWVAVIAGIAAVVSREFGVAVVLYGVHRMLRQHRPWHNAVLVGGTGCAAFALVRWWAAATARGGAPVTMGAALQNAAYWRTPAFAMAFVYFGVLLFGGLSVLLAVRPAWCLRRLRAQPELATYLAVVVVFSAFGSLDIWRYLVFSLPAVVSLLGEYWGDAMPLSTWPLLVAATLVTLVTQRPFDTMDLHSYFRDWFPLYPYFGLYPRAVDFAWVWGLRAMSAVLLVSMVALIARRSLRQGAPIPA